MSHSTCVVAKWCQTTARTTDRASQTSISRHGNFRIPMFRHVLAPNFKPPLHSSRPAACHPDVALDGCHCQSRPRPAEKIRRIHSSPPLGTFYLVMFSFGTIFMRHVMFERAHLVFFSFHLFFFLLSPARCLCSLHALLPCLRPPPLALLFRRLHGGCFEPHNPGFQSFVLGGWTVYLVCICLWWPQKQYSALPSI